MGKCHAPDKNVLVGGDDENECPAKRITLQLEPADDFNQKQERRKLD